MGHYAFIDENNIVTQVIVGRNEDEVVDGISDWEAHYAEVYGQVCKRTSYNSMGGKRRNPETNEMTEEPGFRGNYAGIGYKYDSDLDAFIPPKPFESWTLNTTTFLWDAPTPMPNDGKLYRWNEDTTSWDEVVIPQE
jgi:hypothetical protein